jgi:hypothetical protein
LLHPLAVCRLDINILTPFRVELNAIWCESHDQIAALSGVASNVNRRRAPREVSKTQISGWPLSAEIVTVT